MFHDRPILTLAQVRQWEERSTEIETQMVRLRDEAADLARKLEAARVLMGGVQEEEAKASRPDETSSSGGDGVPTSVLRAVTALEGSPRPAEIRGWIKANIPTAYEKLQRSPTYLYTALLRHAQQGRLVKEGDGYRLPASSARAETGAGDPGSL
jgi:hypothetical protein